MAELFQFDNLGQKDKRSTFFCIPFIKIPNSGLDFGVFSNYLNIPFWSPKPSSPTSFQNRVSPRMLDSNKIGLSILVSFADETKQIEEVAVSSSKCKNEVLDLTINNTSSLPNNHTHSPCSMTKYSNLELGGTNVVFEIGGAQSESTESEPFSHDHAATLISGSLSASAMEPFEDYPISYPSDKFLSFCYLCKEELDKGEDIYIYRGDRAFCSMECRYEHILAEAEKWRQV